MRELSDRKHEDEVKIEPMEETRWYRSSPRSSPLGAVARSWFSSPFPDRWLGRSDSSRTQPDHLPSNQRAFDAFAMIADHRNARYGNQ